MSEKRKPEVDDGCNPAKKGKVCTISDHPKPAANACEYLVGTILPPSPLSETDEERVVNGFNTDMVVPADFNCRTVIETGGTCRIYVSRDVACSDWVLNVAKTVVEHQIESLTTRIYETMNRMEMCKSDEIGLETPPAAESSTTEEIVFSMLDSLIDSTTGNNELKDAPITEEDLEFLMNMKDELTRAIASDENSEESDDVVVLKEIPVVAPPEATPPIHVNAAEITADLIVHPTEITCEPIKPIVNEETVGTEEKQPVLVETQDSTKSSSVLVETKVSQKINPGLVETQDTKKINPVLVKTQDSKKINPVLVETKVSQKISPGLVETQDTKKINPDLVETKVSQKISPVLVETQETKKINLVLVETQDSTKNNPVLVETQDSKKISVNKPPKVEIVAPTQPSETQSTAAAVKAKALPFISSDPKENQDNFDPGWAPFRDAPNDTARYRLIREHWGNLTVPDPCQNLSFRHAGIKQYLTHNNNNQRQMLFKPSRRHTRTQSCTSTYEEMVMKKENDNKAKESNLARNQHREVSNLIQKQNSQYDRGFSDQHISDVLNKHHRQFKNLQSRNQAEIDKLTNYMNEVKSFYEFYNGLDPRDQSDKTIFTEEQIEAREEIEKMYQCFHRFY